MIPLLLSREASKSACERGRVPLCRHLPAISRMAVMHARALFNEQDANDGSLSARIDGPGGNTAHGIDCMVRRD